MSSRQDLTKTQLARAIRIVQDELIWKPDCAERHLRRRIRRNHLPDNATLEDYEALIHQVVHQVQAQIYIYWHNNIVPYISVVNMIDGNTWLVMFNTDGILESAYVVERPQYYLSEPEFELICELGDLL